jgi:hypothetical protein
MFTAALDVVVATVESGVWVATDVGASDVTGAGDDAATVEGDADEGDAGSSEASPQPDNNKNAPATNEPTTTPTKINGRRLERVGRETWPELHQRNMPRS